MRDPFLIKGPAVIFDRILEFIFELISNISKRPIYKPAGISFETVDIYSNKCCHVISQIKRLSAYL